MHSDSETPRGQQKSVIDMAKKDIILSGVGGQGILSIATVIGWAALDQNLHLKQAEVHGMSQRGGDVSTQVRFGSKVYSPIVGRGQADVVVAFEKMEALRWLEYLKPDGKMVINDFEIPSVPILMGAAKYPEGIIEELSSKCDTLTVKAADIAGELGNGKAMNIVLLGALVKAMNVSGIDWKEVITKNVKKGFEELNIKAFEAGYSL